ncbi:MAG: hypothetical protein MZV65_43785 [Chromatiales bacterium]|nr:hypothetical protein [Chromatiales bacterium]
MLLQVLQSDLLSGLLLNLVKVQAAIFLSFIVINVVLSAFISATTAKAAILLPIFMVIAAIYGATERQLTEIILDEASFYRTCFI